jgi:hypothetical protein
MDGPQFKEQVREGDNIHSAPMALKKSATNGDSLHSQVDPVQGTMDGPDFKDQVREGGGHLATMALKKSANHDDSPLCEDPVRVVLDRGLAQPGEEDREHAGINPSAATPKRTTSPRHGAIRRGHVTEIDDDSAEQLSMEENTSERVETVSALLVSSEDVVEAVPITGCFTDKKYRNRAFFGALLLVLLSAVAVAVALTVLPGRNGTPATQGKGESTSNNSVPTMSPSLSRFQVFRQFLLEFSLASDLRNVSSPQWKALNWLVNDDELQLNPERVEAEILKERYLMTLFYFATGGEGWFYKLGFLSANPVCSWNDGTNGVGFDGVACRQNTTVTEITIRKHIFAG